MSCLKKCAHFSPELELMAGRSFFNISGTSAFSSGGPPF